MKLPVSAEEFMPDSKTIRYLDSLTKNIVYMISKELHKRKINGKVSVGGSFAKGTILKSEKYEIDLFVRCMLREDEIASRVAEIVKEVQKGTKWPSEVMQGSREYFRFIVDDKVIFEVVPVAYVIKGEEAKNITDLSYAHVN